ncbi:MAG: hypothetical protein RL642_351 [Bacteroidota bacterium]
MSMNTFNINEKFTFFFDAQLRSNDNWIQAETFIFRPAIGYALNKNTILSLGVAAVTNWRVLPYTGPADEQIMVRDGVSDNRIWQQLVVSKKYGNSTLQHRLRLEERGLGTLATDGKKIIVSNRKFNARFRYFSRWIKPFSPTTGFQKGAYFALQNEFFINTIGARYANNKLFDQSRTYGGFGYRLSKEFDIELGYMLQFIVPNNNKNITNHIAQVSTFVRL